MSYQQYRTEAIVLRSFPTKEADKTLVLFTREFGLVYVHVRSVREERSRQRYALQNFSVANIGLVRGKAGWRLVGATLIGSPPSEQSARRIYARLAHMVTLLVQGEEQNEYLFDVLANAHAAFCDTALPKEGLEVLCAVKMLYALGYFAPEEEQKRLLADATYTQELCEHVERSRAHLLASVNSALAETQLVVARQEEGK